MKVYSETGTRFFGFQSRGIAIKSSLKRKAIAWILSDRSIRRTKMFAVIPGDWVSNEIISQGLYEESFLACLFENLLVSQIGQFSEGVVLDVGANIGNHSLYFARFFHRVLAFEPNPTALSVLRCNCELHPDLSIQVVPVGLGERDEVRVFSQSLSGDMGRSSFYGMAGSKVNDIKCRIRRGDLVLAENVSAAPVRLIKLDIEGGELKALRGLSDTITNFKPVIIFESNVTEGENGGANVLNFLKSLGYSNFYSIERQCESNSRMARLFRKVVFGDGMVVKVITKLSEKRYPCLVASCSTLLP